MTKIDLYVCDGCGKQKQEVNHWWLIGDIEDEWKLLPWSQENAWRFSHACGQSCAVKALSEWMQKGKG